MLTNAMRLLLYVTAMPTAPILVDRISVPAGQDIQAMEKHAKVGLKMSGQHSGLEKSLWQQWKNFPSNLSFYPTMAAAKNGY